MESSTGDDLPPDDGGSAGIVRKARERASARGRIPIALVSALPSTLCESGVEPGPLLGEFGLPGCVFDNPDSTISLQHFGKLIARCVDATGRDDFLLSVCERTGIAAFGLVGRLAEQAPDVRTAISDLVRHGHRSDLAVAGLHVDAGLAALGFALAQPDVPAADQIHDGALAVARNLMLALCGPQWVPATVELSRPRPAWPARYEHFFGAPVRFDAERSAIFFAETWLDRAIRGADAETRRDIQAQIQRLERKRPGNVSETVRSLLRTSGPASAGSVEQVSGLLKTTRRTLARRLAAEGTSFKSLSREVQFDIARHLLGNTSMTMTDIGMSLHYSEPSAFTRAFRHWSGMSPSAWRAARRGEDG